MDSIETQDISNTSKGIVLMVDDDKFLADMYSMKFTQAGYTVYSYLAVEDALKALRNGLEPQAVLFDLVMPGCDGLSFLTSLHNEHLASNAVKIALTNQSSDGEKEQTRALGADEFLIKAMVLPSEVVNIVSEGMRKHHNA